MADRTVGDLMNCLLDTQGVLGIIIFGKYMSWRGTNILGTSLGEIKNDSTESDVDLILFVEKKTLEVMARIKNALMGEDTHIIFHPDFYSVRPPNKVTIDIIVVPKGTKWFSKNHLGRLIGLSIFSSKYLLLSELNINELLVLPQKPKDRYERLNLLLKGYGGLYYFVTMLWSTIGNEILVDARRILRWAIIDTVWALTGEFIRDDPERCVSVLKEEIGGIDDEQRELIDIFTGRKKVQPTLSLEKSVYKFIDSLIPAIRRFID